VPNWQEYEREIEEQFRRAYPGARITANAKLVGKFSKVERQIDLLIEEQASDFTFRIVVDAKHRGRKIDVSDVEAFLGLTRDVEAHTGMMVALEGYTHAAVNRAHHDDLDLVLDVLNFEDLKAYQGFAAIPYAGDNAISIAAPFGWVIDATKRPGMLASLYERGLTFEDAVKKNEFMYVSFWSKKKNDGVDTLDKLLKFQEGYMLENSRDAKIRLLAGVPAQREGANTIIRRFKKKTYPASEYTGFVDFEDFVFMCVLFTPEELERKNLRKLRFVLRDSFRLTVTRDYSAEIKKAEEQLTESVPANVQAAVLAQIGSWYRDMKRYPEAKQALEASLALLPGQYETTKQLLATLIKLADTTATLKVMSQLLRYDPHNPTVFDDCIMYARGSNISWADLATAVEILSKDYPDDRLVEANCNFYTAKILLCVDPISARKKLAAAQPLFRKIFPRGHQVFAAVRSALRQLRQGK
jgi:tetratricopeptide (TPR) repeat protein